MQTRNKMCARKVSFRTKSVAQKVATKFNQRVYECPICFCFHTTNRENWKDEFVWRSEMELALKQQENKIRQPLNDKIRALNAKISTLEKELKKTLKIPA